MAWVRQRAGIQLREHRVTAVGCYALLRRQRPRRTFFVPTIIPFRVSSSENSSLISPAQQPTPATVLVVEDEDFVRRLCARILEEEGYRVLTARDGLEALGVLDSAEAEVRLVISDIRMPRLDGLGLCACLAARRTAPPMIFISGYNVDHPTDYPIVPKPFHPAELITAVERVLHTRGAALRY